MSKFEKYNRYDYKIWLSRRAKRSMGTSVFVGRGEDFLAWRELTRNQKLGMHKSRS